MKHPRGFTLIEILVAMVVLGFVLAGLAQATQFGIRAWNTETRLADRASEQERADRLLRWVFAQARPPQAADDKPFTGDPHKTLFVTAFPAEPETDPVRRMQVALGVNDKHRLVLRWVPHPNASAIKPLPEPQEVILAEGVERADFGYRQSLPDGGKWLQSWTDSNLPTLIRLHVQFDQAKRHWPDFFLPTMIDNNGTF